MQQPDYCCTLASFFAGDPGWCSDTTPPGSQDEESTKRQPLTLAKGLIDYFFLGAGFAGAGLAASGFAAAGLAGSGLAAADFFFSGIAIHLPPGCR
jgi:hypothetical protein